MLTVRKKMYIKERGQYRVAERDEVYSAARSEAKRNFAGRRIKSPKEAARIIEARLCGLEREVFLAVFLDAKLKIIRFFEPFRGTVDRNTIFPRIIVQAALACNAVSLIIAHNHPSGSLTPSESDLHLTRKLVKIFEMIDMKLLDHIIVGAGNFSLSEAGYL